MDVGFELGPDNPDFHFSVIGHLFLSPRSEGLTCGQVMQRDYWKPLVRERRRECMRHCTHNSRLETECLLTLPVWQKFQTRLAEAESPPSRLEIEEAS